MSNPTPKQKARHKRYARLTIFVRKSPLGCGPCADRGVSVRGSRAVLARFSRQAWLGLSHEPSQNALDEARYMNSVFCRPDAGGTLTLGTEEARTNGP